MAQYLIDQPNIMGNYFAGQQAKAQQVEGQKRNALLEMQQQYTQQQQAALGQNQQRAATKDEQDQQRQLIEDLAKVAPWYAQAQSPEEQAQRRNMVVDNYKAMYGDKVEPFRDPARFESALAWAKQEQVKWSNPQAVTGPDGKPAFGQVNDAGQSRIVPGMTPPPKGKGLSVTLPDGTVIDQGGDGPLGMSKPTQGDLEKRLTNAQLGIDRLRQIGQTYDPAFSTYMGRAGAWVSGVKDSAGIASPDEQKKLAAYSEWRANVSSNLSQTFNDLSGAAVSPTEEVRLRAGIPNEEDSPTQFKAKYDATMKRLAQVQARSYIMLKQGLTVDKAPPLEAVDNLIRKRGTELDQVLQQQGVKDKAQRDQQVVVQLQREFGFGQ